jgi:ABC-2 type transport system permease protein
MTGDDARTARARAGRLAALIGKEARQIVRDPSSILIAFVFPLILLFLFGYGVSLDASRTRIAVVVEAPGEAARSLAASFAGSPYFDAEIVHDRREREAAFVRGELGGLVVIPAEFDARTHDRGAAPEVQVLVDGSDPNTATLVQGYAAGVVGQWTQQRRLDRGHAPRAGSPAGAVEDRLWFNPGRTSRWFLVPGVIAIVMAMVGTMLTALVVAREWERGTMEAMLATPITRGELLIGKILPYLALGLIAMAMCSAAGVYMFGVPFRGSVLALLVLSVAYLLPALGQGLVISAVTRNQFLASQLALLSAFLPSLLLSGFLFEISSMPWPLQWLSLIVPARWVIPCLQTVFLTGDLWPLFVRNTAVLLGFGLVLLALAARATPKRIA